MSEYCGIALRGLASIPVMLLMPLVPFIMRMPGLPVGMPLLSVLDRERFRGICIGGTKRDINWPFALFVLSASCLF